MGKSTDKVANYPSTSKVGVAVRFGAPIELPASLNLLLLP
jgi:hypothetical protein